jgi:hypothetical protein
MSIEPVVRGVLFKREMIYIKRFMGRVGLPDKRRYQGVL